jgi:hypothetical protein
LSLSLSLSVGAAFAALAPVQVLVEALSTDERRDCSQRRIGVEEEDRDGWVGRDEVGEEVAGE